MAHEDLTVASAVVIPEPLAIEVKPDASSATSRKRSQSPLSSERNKRSRSNGFSGVRGVEARVSEHSTERHAQQGRRPLEASGSTIEDKRRSQRLFGGLLSTISQRTVSAAERRRIDVEKKQQIKLQQQREEDEQLHHARAGNSRENHEAGPVPWLQAIAATQQANALARTRFLRTETEPGLYYMPTKLRPHELQRISDRSREIAGEAQSVPGARSSRPERDGHERQPNIPNQLSSAQDDSRARPVEGLAAGDTRNSGGGISSAPTEQQVEDRAMSVGPGTFDDGGEMLEGDEDMVIY